MALTPLRGVHLLQAENPVPCSETERVMRCERIAPAPKLHDGIRVFVMNLIRILTDADASAVFVCLPSQCLEPHHDVTHGPRPKKPGGKSSDTCGG